MKREETVCVKETPSACEIRRPAFWSQNGNISTWFESAGVVRRSTPAWWLENRQAKRPGEHDATINAADGGW